MLSEGSFQSLYLVLISAMVLPLFFSSSGILPLQSSVFATGRLYSTIIQWYEHLIIMEYLGAVLGEKVVCQMWYVFGSLLIISLG